MTDTESNLSGSRLSSVIHELVALRREFLVTSEGGCCGSSEELDGFLALADEITEKWSGPDAVSEIRLQRGAGT